MALIPGSKESLDYAIETAQRSDAIVYSILFKDDEESGGYGRPGFGWWDGTAWRHGRTKISATTAPQDGKKTLERISKETGGQMFEVSKKQSVEQIYAQIEDELRHQYNLGYTPNHTDALRVDITRSNSPLKKKMLWCKRGMGITVTANFFSLLSRCLGPRSTGWQCALRARASQQFRSHSANGGHRETQTGEINLKFLCSQWTPESAQQAVTAWLRLSTSRSETIHAVSCQYEASLWAHGKAFEEAFNIADRERWLKLPFTGVDGLHEERQAWVKQGILELARKAM